MEEGAVVVMLFDSLVSQTCPCDSPQETKDLPEIAGCVLIATYDLCDIEERSSIDEAHDKNDTYLGLLPPG
jgi:hypothetical protein